MATSSIHRKIWEIGAVIALLAALGASLGLYYYHKQLNDRLRISLTAPGALNSVLRYVSMGADIRVHNQAGDTPLIVAVSHGHLKLIDYLLNHGVPINGGPQSDEPLLRPLISGINGQAPIQVTQLLIARGADVDAVDPHGTTALMAACERGDLDCVRLLLKAGAKLDLRDDRGRTALRHATDARHQPVVRLLKVAGAQQ